MRQLAWCTSQQEGGMPGLDQVVVQAGQLLLVAQCLGWGPRFWVRVQHGQQESSLLQPARTLSHGQPAMRAQDTHGLRAPFPAFDMRFLDQRSDMSTQKTAAVVSLAMRAGAPGQQTQRQEYCGPASSQETSA